jgi:hypothetical protein
MGHSAYEFLYHLSSRRKFSLWGPYDVLHKVVLLLCCYFALPDVLSSGIHLNTSVKARQRRSITTGIFCNSSIRDIFAGLQIIDLPQCIVDSGIVVAKSRVKRMVLHGWGGRHASMGGTRTDTVHSWSLAVHRIDSCDSNIEWRVSRSLHYLQQFNNVRAPCRPLKSRRSLTVSLQPRNRRCKQAEDPGCCAFALTKCFQRCPELKRVIFPPLTR